VRDLFILTGIFSFLVGVLLRSIITLSPNIFLPIFVVSLALMILFFFFKKRNLILLAIILTTFALGVLRLDIKLSKEQRNIFDQALLEKVSFEGVIISEPDKREYNQRLVILVGDTKILVSTEIYPEYSYGDKISVNGVLRKPQNFITDIGKEFNYVDYLAKDGIHYQIFSAKTIFIESGHGNSLKRFLLKNKRAFLNKTKEIISEPQSSLLGGLLLGTKQSLGKTLEQKFIDTGLIHIVVLSGYNVTIIAEAIMWSLGFLPRLAGISLGSVSIALFAIMTGAGATIVRASIMAILALVGRATGNEYNVTRALFFAGFLMVLHNPMILYFDISFQLSFLATLGLIELSPILEKHLKWITEKFGLRQIASATLATQIFVLPFILYKMGTLSIVAPITNMIVLPLIPATMLFGFLAGVFGLVSFFLALPFGFIAEKLLTFEIFIVRVFADLPFAVFEIRNFSFFWIILLYCMFFWIILRHNNLLQNFHKKEIKENVKIKTNGE